MSNKKSDGQNFEIEVCKKSTRKYPNVIWFPRSKTDPREIREVLKLSLKTQEENPGKFFNDKLLGKQMAQIGSINVIGLDGEKYIESYKDKSTGDVSYITNARMLIRLFRFLGFVTRIEKGKYILTDLGKLFCSFSGDFPDYKNDTSEEYMLLDSLSNFAFYSVNDDANYRDEKFKIRPFVWLLQTLSFEPQCIYQLIITAFASISEGEEEEKRIKSILSNLRKGSTDLKSEWEKVGLDADNYSCVHNFYDSVKILVYLGMSLGLIEKTSNASYGKKIAGRGRHLKQATIFYTLTEKGNLFVKKALKDTLIFYEQAYNVFKDENILQAVILLASLNHRLGTLQVEKIRSNFFDSSFDIKTIIEKFKKHFAVEINLKDDFLILKDPVSFSFYQSIPPEILHLEFVKAYYNKLILGVEENKEILTITTKHSKIDRSSEFSPYFELDKERHYFATDKKTDEIEKAIKYPMDKEVYGGQDRFSSRVSPTNSVIAEKDTLYVNNNEDALDLLVPLRLDDPVLRDFIGKNTLDLLKQFMQKSDVWEKDQHYTWIRNCLRHFGMEAIYSGSGGMLARADVSVISPFIGGIEAKSPRENRGTINTKAIRQAVDAKIQVADRYNTDLPRAAIAIGRRITPQAIQEERKWAKENQPILLLHDAVLHYLVLKSSSLKLSIESLVEFFTSNHSSVTTPMLINLFTANTSDKIILKRIEHELVDLEEYMAPDDN